MLVYQVFGFFVFTIFVGNFRHPLHQNNRTSYKFPPTLLSGRGHVPSRTRARTVPSVRSSHSGRARVPIKKVAEKDKTVYIKWWRKY